MPASDDYYKVLGIARDASPADIQKAYRTLARKYHPDVNPDDKKAKEKFQKVQAAFDVLNDPSKREMYDRYGSSFESMAGGRGYTQSAGGQGGPAGFEDFDFSQFFGERFGGDPSGGFGDIFGQFRRAGGGGRTRRTKSAPRTGADLQSEITIPLKTAVAGGEVDLGITRESGKTDTLRVKIPPGVEDGAKIRLRGQGEPGAASGEAGDILLTVHVQPHPVFQRRGNHLDVKVPVTLTEAVFGAKVDVPTPKGTISLRIPPRTSSGTKLRVKGHGVTPRKGDPGDLYAEIQIILPEKLDEEALAVLRRLGENISNDPRADLQW